jgi:hypothetical protein
VVHWFFCIFMMGGRHPGDLHVDLSVEVNSTGHPGVLYSHLYEGEPGRKHPVVPHSHLD